MIKAQEHIDDTTLIGQLRTPATVDRAMRTVITQYGEMLYRKIRQITRDHADADDVMQKTLVKVFKHIDQFKGESRLSTWMYQIATREALGHIRSKNRKRTMALPEEYTSSGGKAVVQQFDPDEAESWVLEACIRLPKVQRQVFEYRYYENLPFKEISRRLGTSEGGLKASYHHAANKVEEYLKNKLIQ